MNIENLTIKEAREIAAMFSAVAGAVFKCPHIGRHVIVRTYSAGVHAGVLTAQHGDEVVLHNSRRLWSWKAKGGIALSGVAVHGLASGKVDVPVSEHHLIGAIEIIPTTDTAEASINAA